MNRRTIAILFAVFMAPMSAPRVARAWADPARFETAIRAFEEQDRNSAPPAGATLFLGSSSIRLWPIETSFPERTTIHRGFGGSTIADSLHYADRIVFPYRPRAIVFYAGDNDVAAGMSAREVTADFERFAAKVFEALPETTILFISIKPSIKRWNLAGTMLEINDAVRSLAEKEPRLRYVDVWLPMLGPDGKPIKDLFVADGLHLGPKGYALWTTLVENALSELDKSAK